MITCALAIALASEVRADPVEDFYKGKTVRIIIGYGVGGGYDLYGRAAAEFLGRFIPGKPTIVPQNMPTGGSFVAAKYMFEAAPRDGTVLGVLAQTLALDTVMQGDKAGIVVAEMPYIGRMTTSVEVGHGLPNAPFKNFDDARQREIVVGASGGASPAFLLPAALNAFAGAKFKIVSGYAGVNEIVLAAERGELQLVPSAGLPIIMAKNPEWITEKKVPILYGASLKRHPLIPDVPTLGELGLTEQDKSILRVIASSGDFGRSINTTPGVPKERLAALRKAFQDMVRDPEFQARMAERRIIIEPATGEELDEIAKETTRTPKSALERIAALIKK
jgi:tripartite-type tricarboxylate transporter receptor subunit TctC